MNIIEKWLTKKSEPPPPQATAKFEIGDIVGIGFSAMALQIKLVGVYTDQINAKVVCIGHEFSAEKKAGGFRLGEALTLLPSGEDWIIEDGEDRPRFVLRCRDGVKTFVVRGE